MAKRMRQAMLKLQIRAKRLKEKKREGVIVH